MNANPIRRHREFAFDGPCGVDYRESGVTVLIHCIYETCPVIRNATSHVRARAVGQMPGLLPNLVTAEAASKCSCQLPGLRGLARKPDCESNSRVPL